MASSSAAPPGELLLRLAVQPPYRAILRCAADCTAGDVLRQLHADAAERDWDELAGCELRLRGLELPGETPLAPLADARGRVTLELRLQAVLSDEDAREELFAMLLKSPPIRRGAAPLTPMSDGEFEKLFGPALPVCASVAPGRGASPPLTRLGVARLRGGLGGLVGVGSLRRLRRGRRPLPRRRLVP